MAELDLQTLQRLLAGGGQPQQRLSGPEMMLLGLNPGFVQGFAKKKMEEDAANAEMKKLVLGEAIRGILKQQEDERGRAIKETEATQKRGAMESLINQQLGR